MENSTISFPIVVQRTKDKGRHVIAGRNIQAGEIILRTKAYSANVSDNYKVNVCGTCFHQSNKKYKFRCASCNEIFYCSSKCYDQSEHIPKSLECITLSLLSGVRSGFNVDHVSGIRVVLSTICKGLSEVIDQNEIDETNPGYDEDLKTVNKNLIETSLNPKFTEILILEGNQQQIEEEDMEVVINQATSLLNILEKALKLATLTPNMQKNWPILVKQSVFVRLFCNHKCNSYGIWNQKYKCLGSCLYASGSYLNHSCFPNCSRFSDSKKNSNLTIRALYPIRKGEELNICYSEFDSKFTVRQDTFKSFYYFPCACVRCNIEKKTIGNRSKIIESSMEDIKCHVCVGFMVPLDFNCIPVEDQLLQLQCNNRYPTKKCFLKDEPDFPRFEDHSLITRKCNFCGALDPAGANTYKNFHNRVWNKLTKL